MTNYSEARVSFSWQRTDPALVGAAAKLPRLWGEFPYAIIEGVFKSKGIIHEKLQMRPFGVKLLTHAVNDD